MRSHMPSASWKNCNTEHGQQVDGMSDIKAKHMHAKLAGWRAMARTTDTTSYACS